MTPPGQYRPPPPSRGHGSTVGFQRVDPIGRAAPRHQTRTCNEAHPSYISPARLGINRKMTSPATTFVRGARNARDAATNDADPAERCAAAALISDGGGERCHLPWPPTLGRLTSTRGSRGAFAPANAVRGVQSKVLILAATTLRSMPRSYAHCVAHRAALKDCREPGTKRQPGRTCKTFRKTCKTGMHTELLTP
jgi:hypothetical protein